ncbi:oligopeptide transport system ATP-binding protein [Candidatus Planktophila limnetica]|uniref:Oligopeptide transport system ATP-binding protein n=1 Tax=Candidatus Planktophila limnetica TaxID=573600 RepID=A0A249LG17_9ACTN|nr:dipeptide ABC transporter ATP-binding protein [Candidatus Planktophila limnetica]ASY27947.1 oligopeptide transport system ATP-binding protein [Candidatus Planktophila limnetica]
MSNEILSVKNISKIYESSGGSFGRKNKVSALDGVSFNLAQGETLGIVGESGCGKSTLGRIISRLDSPTSGEIIYKGNDIAKKSLAAMRPLRKEIQFIFQDPYASLNPRRQIGAIIEEPMRIHGVSKDERRARAHELLEKVGLDKNSYEKYPHEFSGGQRQRVVIARALTLKPELIIADEPVSALDVSIQAQVLNLFKELQDEMKLTYVFVAHDLGVVRHISDRIAVMYLGKIVELGTVEEIYNNPQHPYTKALLSANPRIDQSAQNTRQILTGDIPSPLNRPSGCSFHTRCPIAVAECSTREPELRRIGAVDVACNLVV